jgi:hypothetical protein
MGFPSLAMTNGLSIEASLARSARKNISGNTDKNQAQKKGTVSHKNGIDNPPEAEKHQQHIRKIRPG